MAKHSHAFVETYDGFVGFGFDRETDEKTLIYYLQKFSDDALMQTLVKRMSEKDLGEMFALVNQLMKAYLSDTEYHALFLKDEHPH